jgi:cytochrome c-type biogenesis protein CcmH/NrfG
MVDESRAAVTESAWQAKHAYAMAVVCLLLGLLAGYLLRGSESSKTAATAATAAAMAPGAAAAATPMGAPSQPMPTLEQMKHMADRTAEPLLTKLQSDPKNAALLAQIGKVYESAHQFKEAADYYGKSLEVDPTNVANRTAMASCLYYNGDVDGAITQLEQSLRDDPKNANSLFNLGMIKWKGKNDAQGAAAAWEQLLKSNPSLEAAKKAQVKKLLADVKQQSAVH